MWYPTYLMNHTKTPLYSLSYLINELIMTAYQSKQRINNILCDQMSVLIFIDVKIMVLQCYDQHGA